MPKNSSMYSEIFQDAKKLLNIIRYFPGYLKIPQYIPKFSRMPDTAGQSNCDCRRDVGGGGRGGGADNARLLDRILPTAIHTYQVCMQFRLTNYIFLKFRVW